MNKENSKIYCRKIAINLLGNGEETEKIIGENLSENFENTAENIRAAAFEKSKNGCGFENMDKIRSELSECIPEKGRKISGSELSQAVGLWLEKQKKGTRSFFIRRYWFGERRGILSAAGHLSVEKLDKKLLKTRKSLCSFFEKSGISPENEEEFFSSIFAAGMAFSEEAYDFKWYKPIYRFWQFWAAIGVVLCAILVFVVIKINAEKNSQYNYYFRDCIYNWSDSDYSFKELENSIEYTSTRSFGYLRKSLENSGSIPPFKNYQTFSGTGYYDEKMELQRLSLSWEHISYMGLGYKKIRISFVPGTEDEVPASMLLPVTESGRAIEGVTTVSNRDGIKIYGVSDGRVVMMNSANAEKIVRKLMFYKDGYWIEMDGLRMGANDMGEFLEWLFEEEIKLERFENPAEW